MSALSEQHARPIIIHDGTLIRMRFTKTVAEPFMFDCQYYDVFDRLILTVDESVDVLLYIVALNIKHDAFSVFVTLEHTCSSIDVRMIYGSFVHKTCTITTEQRHTAALTKSSFLVKTVLSGSSHANLFGTIAIDHAARGTDATLYYKTLLLESSTTTTSKPQLEIKTNNVRCKHGSAVSSLDQEQLWYLYSRGIAQPHARQMVVYAFVVDAIPAVYKKRVQEAISRYI